MRHCMTSSSYSIHGTDYISVVQKLVDVVLKRHRGKRICQSYKIFADCCLESARPLYRGYE